MDKVIFDASVVIALLEHEANTDISLIEQLLPYSIVSTVNVLEVAQFLFKKGMPMDKVWQLLRELLPEIYVLSLEGAYSAAELISFS